MKKVVIVSATRTPIGSFLGSLSNISATDLGAQSIKNTIQKINLNPELIDEVFMGNVLQANTGQAPAKQCAIKAGLGNNIPCTTINKVCSSGMKAIMIGAQSIMSGHNEIVLAGGMENMSQVPHYMINSRSGYKLGNGKLVDGLIVDGLTDVYNNTHMGNCAEICAKEMNISREEQDNFAIESYKKSANAWKNGKFKNEVCGIEVKQRKGDPLKINEDEEFKNVKMDKIPHLKPVFEKEGTVTAANASTLNDGAASLIIMSEEKAKQLNLTPLCKIVSFADAAHKPEWFTTAPEKAIKKAINLSGKSIEDIDFFELNEAFSVVGLANIKLLNIQTEKVNLYGGAVSLGHPLGCSGARIVITLINVLNQEKGKIGVAGICNGGGGASAIVIEK
tara:strand:+ start:1941 stop:3116 length:1176 start_codon:yes stop_codon:yes gene_type:complete